MTNPSCKKEQIILYITNELSYKERKNLRKHVITCKKCQQLIEEYSKIDNLLQTRKSYIPSDTLMKKCLSLVKKHKNEPVNVNAGTLRQLYNRIPRPLVQTAVLSVVFLIGMYTGYSILSNRNNSAISEMESKRYPKEFSNFLMDVQTFLLMYKNSYQESLGQNPKTVELATDLTRKARKVKKKLSDQELVSMCREIEVLLNNIIFSEKTYTIQMREQIKKDITEKRLFTRINSII